MTKISTEETFSEKGIWIRFGLLPVHLKPLTLAQIWEIGELVNTCEQLDIQGTFNGIEKMLSMHKDIRVLQKVVIKAIFRSSIARFLFGWYIAKKTTMTRYNEVITFCAQSFNAPFFFQSMTFLRGSAKQTMNTREVQVHGGSSEE